jgi:two-component system chemotaxis response regulator CheY
MVSAETDKKQISEALELGADQYITKPFKTTTLKTTIVQLLIGTTTFADKKVMVVDDSPTMRRIVTKNLIQAGFNESNIIEAPDGEEALNLLSGEEVDLIISDWHMPKMNGLEFLKRVRASETRKDIPVLMVTAEMHKENILDAIKAGVNDYIIKPFNAIQLQDKIKKVYYPSSD